MFMKRFRFAAFCAALLAFTACDVVKQAEGLYNMTQCEYEYDSVTDLSLAGVNLSGELTPLQIARLLGVPEGTVKTRLRTAREQLRKNLEGACFA